jgi:hypothetical protein
MGGSGPKSVSGSSWWNSELSENGKDTMVLAGSGLRRVKPYVQCVMGLCGKVISSRMEL